MLPATGLVLGGKIDAQCVQVQESESRGRVPVIVCSAPKPCPARGSISGSRAGRRCNPSATPDTSGSLASNDKN